MNGRRPKEESTRVELDPPRSTWSTGKQVSLFSSHFHLRLTSSLPHHADFTTDVSGLTPVPGPAHDRVRPKSLRLSLWSCGTRDSDQRAPMTPAHTPTFALKSVSGLGSGQGLLETSHPPRREVFIPRRVGCRRSVTDVSRRGFYSRGSGRMSRRRPRTPVRRFLSELLSVPDGVLVSCVLGPSRTSSPFTDPSRVCRRLGTAESLTPWYLLGGSSYRPEPGKTAPVSTTPHRRQDEGHADPPHTRPGPVALHPSLPYPVTFRCRPLIGPHKDTDNGHGRPLPCSPVRPSGFLRLWCRTSLRP